MKQGTVSVLVGCHSPVHSVLVVLAWKKLYGKWPKPWQGVCIFLHDIGHWGKDYLKDLKQKERHWMLGATVANRLFGWKGIALTAGHCEHCYGCEQSEMYKADKYSWHLAPTWWLLWNNVVEPDLRVNCKTNLEAVRKFQATVKESVESGKFISTHSMYLARKAGSGT